MFRAIAEHVKHYIFLITKSKKEAIWRYVEPGFTDNPHLYVTVTNH